MYYLLYGLLYLISLLPYFIIYRISDVAYLLLYHVFRYRRKVVMYNLGIAFPEKSTAEKAAIARKFYRNLTDTFIESIKMLSMSTRTFEKRCTIDIAPLNELAAQGKNIQLHSGHQMNWEYANWIFAKNLVVPWIGVYQPISSPSFNRIFHQMRSRYGTVLVSTKEFAATMHQFIHKPYCLALAADQNTHPGKGYWLYFFQKPVPFISGPDKGALKKDTAVVFADIEIKKRGHYHIACKVITPSAGNMQPGELTRLYRNLLEETIRKYPDNYLWTHRRWRHAYSPAFAAQWMDNRPAPTANIN
jgi:KDO2-lipid IV(A) lauroyltransferase